MNRRWTQRPARTTTSRRHFLGALGTCAAIAPFVPLLDREVARGQPRAAPKRLVLFFWPNGCIHENWEPRGTERDFELNTIMEPLAPYKDRLVVPTGLGIPLSTHPETGEFFTDAHITGMLGLWTGSHVSQGRNQIEGTHYAMGPSIDQVVARHIGGDTPFRSLELSVSSDVDSGGRTPWNRMIFAGANQPLDPESDPRQSFVRLFGGLDPNAANDARRVATKRSVLDYVRSDLARVRAGVGVADRLKVDAHTDAIRALERRLDASSTTCRPPGSPEFGASDHEDTDAFPAVCDRMVEQLVLALACDLTRVASLQLSHSGSLLRYVGLDVPETGHHTMAHDEWDNASLVAPLTKINQFYMGVVAKMLERMDSIPEGDGTLLDHTLVVCGNELARGSTHHLHPMPFLLAGSAGGALRTGRYIDYERLEHQRLLTSIGQIFGLDVETFGDNDSGAGGLPGLL